MKLIASLAVLAAAASTANAAKAYIKNNCKAEEPVYMWPIDVERRDPKPELLEAGKMWSEEYHTPKTGGVSIKLSRSTDRSAGIITQFEYTLIGGQIWYDGSHVDCRGAKCPFYKDGMYLKASKPSCPTRTCLPNQDCTGFYINYNDDINTLSCDPSADIYLYLCSTSDADVPSTPAAPVTPAAIEAPKTPAKVDTASPVNVKSPVEKSPELKAVPSELPVVKMEAVQKWTPPTTLQTVSLVARSTPAAKLRRHAHGHRH